jgi:hypothetical protein
VWPVAAFWSQLNIYLSLAVPLALFGHQLGHGLNFHWWILKTCMVILFGLLSQLEVLERAALSFSSSGSYV